MRVLSEMDRFHLAKDIADVVYGQESINFKELMNQKLNAHSQHIREFGEDLDEVQNWQWKTLTK